MPRSSRRRSAVGPPPTFETRAAQRLDAGGQRFADAARSVPEETPIALSFNGITHAVMLATPADLEEFGIGFALAEGIVAGHEEILDIEVTVMDDGIEVAMDLTARRAAALGERRRTLAGATGCGLCGVDSLAQANRTPGSLTDRFAIPEAAIRRGLMALPQEQSLNAQTGAAHAAAWIDGDGRLAALREDVGRHNALDKLIGALALAGTDMRAGAALLTSRCSVELVMKAASVGIPGLVAVSAPTARAVRLAETVNLTLVALARADSMLAFAGAQRLRAGAGS